MGRISFGTTDFRRQSDRCHRLDIRPPSQTVFGPGWHSCAGAYKGDIRLIWHKYRLKERENVAMVRKGRELAAYARLMYDKMSLHSRRRQRPWGWIVWWYRKTEWEIRRETRRGRKVLLLKVRLHRKLGTKPKAICISHRVFWNSSQSRLNPTPGPLFGPCWASSSDFSFNHTVLLSCLRIRNEHQPSGTSMSELL